MSRGRFITFEGGEGAGKSTQLARLAQRLTDGGEPVLMTREPGGTDGAEAIRNVLLSGPGLDALGEALLHFAARHDHLQRRLRPALAEGMWVLCDRFVDSTWAYQVAGMGLARASFEALTQLVVADLKPDLTFVFDIAPEVGLERAGRDAYESRPIEFHRRVQQAFREIAQREPGRCRLVDAAAPLESVTAFVWDEVQKRFGALP